MSAPTWSHPPSWSRPTYSPRSTSLYSLGFTSFLTEECLPWPKYFSVGSLWYVLGLDPMLGTLAFRRPWAFRKIPYGRIIRKNSHPSECNPSGLIRPNQVSS
uniref:Uncharacterized protein n=1 Tax=Picea glauca TaxID=3330 RepID=A0A101M552_PICGL|nr:hypothetical protein ABT39_MTgene1136 [Picea glauca]QHR90613.1 hypothetical protein Q903MT_gene4638 [Picea sitchensis]